MIEDVFTIKDWVILGLYTTDSYDAELILSYMNKLGCNAEQAQRAYDLATSNAYNTGCTFANLFTKRAIIVIGPFTTPSQGINTIIHESRHLLEYIAISENLQSNSESVCYLIAHIGLHIFDLYVNLKLL